MAEEKVEPRETSWRQMLPWTELFRGFQVALDVNKLILAAAGILVMAFGWWLLALLFTAGESKTPPQWPGAYLERFAPDKGRAWDQFRQDRDHWNLMHESAGLGDPRLRVEPIDRIDSYEDWADYDTAVKGFVASQMAAEAAEKAVAEDRAARDEALRHAAGNPDDDPGVQKAKKTLADAEARVKRTPLEDFLKANHIPDAKAALLASLNDGKGHYKPYGTLATWPWFEERGPNPFLMATGQLGKPWEVGHFWEWFLTQQVPVLIEPIVKLLLPIVYFFSPGADLKSRFYFLCVLIWTVATWSVFGGAITRIAAVQVARGEKIGLVDAVRFTLKRILSYVTAPLFPLLFVFVLLVVMVLFGFPFMIPIFGDLMAGLLWPVMVLLGLLMAVALVGLVGWPLMSATVSAEGTDSWEAVSRSYSYVYQKPWHFIWYALVAIAYGAVIVFFVGFMGSLAVYLAKWGVSQTPGITAVHREPNFLFVYAPTSFGWRSLLLKGAVVDGDPVVDADGQINETAYNKWIGANPDYNGPDRLAWWNLFGAFLVGVWLWIMFLLILGFGYSYFWSASTIIYMLLRRNVDAAEMDEVYLEDEDGEGAFGGPLTPPAASPAPAVKPGAQSLTMVDAPSLRPAPVAPPPAAGAGRRFRRRDRRRRRRRPPRRRRAGACRDAAGAPWTAAPRPPESQAIKAMCDLARCASKDPLRIPRSRLSGWYEATLRGPPMARPILLFTGQWADLPLEELAPHVAEWGYQGVDLCCWGDHFEVQRALSDDEYCTNKLALFNRLELAAPIVSCHRVSHAVCDVIDGRHQDILPEYVWGDGDPVGVQQRAAQEVMGAARAAQRLGASVLAGFTGSPIWGAVTGYPSPKPQRVADAYREFARKWRPILDVIQECGLKYAFEVHPGQIAFDLFSAEAALDALDGRPDFGFTFDPSHFFWQGVDPVEFVRRFPDRIFHVHIKDAVLTLNGRTGLLCSYLPYGDPRRGWHPRSPGRGGLDWEAIIRALNDIGYDGALTVEFQDAGMNREHGAEEACRFVKRLDFEPAPRDGGPAFR